MNGLKQFTELTGHKEVKHKKPLLKVNVSARVKSSLLSMRIEVKRCL